MTDGGLGPRPRSLKSGIETAGEGAGAGGAGGRAWGAGAAGGGGATGWLCPPGAGTGCRGATAGYACATGTEAGLGGCATGRAGAAAARDIPWMTGAGSGSSSAIPTATGRSPPSDSISKSMSGMGSSMTSNFTSGAAGVVGAADGDVHVVFRGGRNGQRHWGGGEGRPGRPRHRGFPHRRAHGREIIEERTQVGALLRPLLSLDGSGGGAPGRRGSRSGRAWRGRCFHGCHGGSDGR
jgi:hypothetical protein